MILNNIKIIQQNENQYLFYLSNNMCICNLILPINSKNAFMANAKVMESISKILAVRFGAYDKKE